MINVAVNGYGVIGKRVADAAAAQPDMQVVGVADTATDYRVALARHHGYDLYGSTEEAVAEMAAAGLDPGGGLSDLLAAADVVVDTTPKGIGAANKTVYEAAGVKAVFQGGEPHELTGRSFVAQANYREAIGQRFVRVVSCNTTATVRVLNAFETRGHLRRARLTLIRRATDPWESHLGGMINTLLPEPHIPSHQGPDALTVLPGLDLVTIAASGPFNLAHVHFAAIETPTPMTRGDVLELLEQAPRIALIRADQGVAAPNSVLEITRDLGRPRGDLWEVALFEDTLTVQDNEVFCSYIVHNESIVVPENIDAIRALAGVEPDAATSIARTDTALGIRSRLP